jgi:hypothetical protein
MKQKKLYEAVNTITGTRSSVLQWGGKFQLVCNWVLGWETFVEYGIVLKECKSILVVTRIEITDETTFVFVM